MPFTFVDIGVDGVRGTADDRTLTYARLAVGHAATQFPTTQVVMNLPQYARYKTFETVDEQALRQPLVGVARRRLHLDERFPERLSRRTRIKPGVEDRTVWNFKASGSYDAPWGIRLSPVLRHQSGVNYARTGTLTFPAGVTGTGTAIYMEPSNANREDNIWVFDVRAEKTVNFTDRVRDAAVPRRLQHHEQPRVGNDQPRHGHGLPEAVGHPGARYRQGRLPVPLVEAEAWHLVPMATRHQARGTSVFDSCGGVRGVGGATPAPPPFFIKLWV